MGCIALHFAYTLHGRMEDDAIIVGGEKEVASASHMHPAFAVKLREERTEFVDGGVFQKLTGLDVEAESVGYVVAHKDFCLK